MYPFSTLPPRLSSTVFAELRASLPPPLDDSQEALDGRDMMAMAAVASLGPCDVTEALLAAQVVAAEAHARDAMRLTNTHRADLGMVLRCRAQAASMIRTMHRALGVLHRMQAMRPLGMAAVPAGAAEPASRAVPTANDADARGADATAADAGTANGGHARDAAAAVASHPVPARSASRSAGEAYAARKQAIGAKVAARTPRHANVLPPGTVPPPGASQTGTAHGGVSSDGWTAWRDWPAMQSAARVSIPLPPSGSDGQVA